ncbi:hypothetical protein RZS08_00080, partial [Arthrospira platensis SPKY1]|nr:hypothetical protein [Arthrospira platensis SPKY1]
GFLCPPQAQAVADRLLAIAADCACLIPIHEWLASFRHRSVAEMVADYHALVPLPEFSAVRYFTMSATLPEESAANDSPRALHIDARFPFSQALREFGQYARLKLATTPR